MTTTTYENGTAVILCDGDCGMVALSILNRPHRGGDLATVEMTPEEARRLGERILDRARAAVGVEPAPDSGKKRPG